MKLSLQTGILDTRVGVEECFRMMKDAGFEAAEINLDVILDAKMMREGDIDAYLNMPQDELNHLYDEHMAAAAKYGIVFTQAHAPFPTRIAAQPRVNEKITEILSKTARTCQYMSCPRMVVHAGYLADPCDKQEEWDYNMKLYTSLIPVLKETGVMVCVENLFRSTPEGITPGPCWNGEELARYVDALNELAGEELFGALIDVGHVALVKQDIRAFINTVGHRLKALHIHDNNGIRDLHVLPYTGVIDWDAFCQGLKDIGYDNDLSFETFNALRVFDAELTEQVVNMVGATAQLFRRKVKGQSPIKMKA